MKKTYLYGLLANLLVAGLSAHAQSGPTPAGYALGTAQALVRQLEGQVRTSAARGAGVSTVTLRVSGTQAFTGKVNYRQDLSTSGELVVGELVGVPKASFMVRIEGQHVTGNIVLRASKQAYRYTADAHGQVSVQEVDIDKVLCVDYNKPVDYQQPAAPQRVAKRTAAVSLQSYPGGRGCVLLDFDGEYVTGTPWNSDGAPIIAEPANITDADIREFWGLVSEDFRPFSMNVTTDAAVFNSYPKTMRMRCIITPTTPTSVPPGVSGVAYLSSFKWNDDSPCWVFLQDPKLGAETASHEVGHTLGLHHDGRNHPVEGHEEYYSSLDNEGPWAPIMGIGFYKTVVQWSMGEYNFANNQEDDIATISASFNEIGYRIDDHANATSGATALARNGTALSGAGVIERTEDQDFFSFTAGAGTVSLSVSPVSQNANLYHANLDIVARLYNSTGGLIGTYNSPALALSFSANVAAGTYYVSIDGTSNMDPATTGYSDYASLGAFTISGTAPESGKPPVTSAATLYRQCYYESTAFGLEVGDYNLAALRAKGILDNDLSSLKVSSGYEVQLFADDNFTGTSLVFRANTDCLAASGLDERVSSLKVRAVATPSLLIQAESYTAMKGVQLEGCADAGGTQNVGWIDAGDWMAYSNVRFATSGSYLIEYRVASPGGGKLSADLNAGAIQLGQVTIPATGGWQTWRTVSHTVSVTAGTYSFGVFAQTGGWNFNWLRITKVGAGGPAPAGAVAQAGGVAQAAGLVPPVTALNVYPNPVTNRLMLASAGEFLGQELTILSAEGKPAWHGTYSGEAVDVAALPSGLYLLVAYTKDHHKLVSRFSKQ